MLDMFLKCAMHDLRFFGVFSRVRERRHMLDTLLKWVRNNAISVEQWDEHFKSILLILIETFGDSDVSTL